MFQARIDVEEVRHRTSWAQTAAIIATLANCHRDPKRRSTPYDPADFNPYTQLDRAAGPVRKIKASDLARIVCGNERPDQVLAEVAARDANSQSPVTSP